MFSFYIMTLKHFISFFIHMHRYPIANDAIFCIFNFYFCCDWIVERWILVLWINKILTDQDNCISKVIWEGQVESILSLLNFNIILLVSDGSLQVFCYDVMYLLIAGTWPTEVYLLDVIVVD